MLSPAPCEVRCERARQTSREIAFSQVQVGYSQRVICSLGTPSQVARAGQQGRPSARAAVIAHHSTIALLLLQYRYLRY
jgi:hypothetical protein